MSNVFLTTEKVSLNPAGYLVSTESGNPVIHAEFVKEQKVAEYTVKLAEAIKGKTFTASKVDSLDAIKKEVLKSINNTNTTKYVDAPSKPLSATNDELIKFALDFVDYENNVQSSKKVNEFMQEFNTLNAIEQIGDYFQEGLVKLNKIYTIAEILEAVKVHVEILG